MFDLTSGKAWGWSQSNTQKDCKQRRLTLKFSHICRKMTREEFFAIHNSGTMKNLEPGDLVAVLDSSKIARVCENPGRDPFVRIFKGGEYSGGMGWYGHWLQDTNSVFGIKAFLRGWDGKPIKVVRIVHMCQRAAIVVPVPCNNEEVWSYEGAIHSEEISS